MVGPPVSRVRILQRASPDAPELVRAVTQASWAGGAEVLKSNDRSSVLAGEACGRGVVVKSVLIGGVRNRIARVAGRTRLGREWRGRGRLARTGVPVVEFLALVRGTAPDGVPVESIVMRRVEGRTLLRVLAEGGTGVREEHALGAAVGALAAQISACGLHNRDFKASNVIAARDGSAWRLTLIDVADVGASRGRDGLEMVAKAAIECLGTGVLPRRAVLMRALTVFCDASGARRQVHEAWRRVRRIIERHGDPTPKDDPLL